MERLGDSANRVLASAGVPEAGPFTRAVEIWPGVVGEAIAHAAWPARLGRDGVLHVATGSSAWAFELDRLGPEIHARLTAALGDDAPAALRFAVGRIPARSTVSSVDDPPERPRIASGDLAEGDRIAAPIADDELRSLVARAAAASLARGRSGRRFC